MSNVVHLKWTGPYTLDEVEKEGKDEKTSYGIYQVYGTHPIYGLDILLYIGQASDQTFARRLAEHPWRDFEFDDSDKVHVRLGRLWGELKSQPENTELANVEWAKSIDTAERLLITSHKPAWNKQNAGYLCDDVNDPCRNAHVLNWGQRGRLLPEVSGERWTSKHFTVGENEWKVWEYNARCDS